MMMIQSKCFKLPKSSRNAKKHFALSESANTFSLCQSKATGPKSEFQWNLGVGISTKRLSPNYESIYTFTDICIPSQIFIYLHRYSYTFTDNL